MFETGTAWFDTAQQAWILSSHADVSAALREPRLAPAGSAEGSSAHLAVHEAVSHSMAHLTSLRAGFIRSAHDLATRLPIDRPVDLVASFAAPWSLELAASVTGTSLADAAACLPQARVIFRAAAFGTDSESHPAAQAAAVELARRLPAATAAINVQTFVALSQTLPHTLAGVWLALFGDPAAAHQVRARPGLLPQAVEELLRHSGPSRAVFRHAHADVRIGCASIGRGDRVVLMLDAANHDPARFADPDRLDFSRDTGGHVAFGGGAHACAGARLIRVALAAGTGALLHAFTGIERVGPVRWIRGFAIRAPASLPAVLRRRAADPPPPLAADRPRTGEGPGQWRCPA